MLGLQLCRMLKGVTSLALNQLCLRNSIWWMIFFFFQIPPNLAAVFRSPFLALFILELCGADVSFLPALGNLCLLLATTHFPSF